MASFFYPDRAPTVRDRSGVTSAGLRKIEYLPPSEIDEGILTLVKDNFGAAEEVVVQVLARQLGYRATSAQLREAIMGRIGKLKELRRLTLEDYVLVVTGG